ETCRAARSRRGHGRSRRFQAPGRVIAVTPGAQAGAVPREFPGPSAATDLARGRASRALERIGQAIVAARDALLGLQQADGHWLFELEADCTIPAEYILMMHYLDEIEPELERKLAVYLRDHQANHGGWPLYHGGELDLSCTVKVYYALKLVGDDPDAPHMRRAREAILARGGAAHVNVFTRIALALFG